MEGTMQRGKDTSAETASACGPDRSVRDVVAYGEGRTGSG
jgi:hypothetical protein